jgi:hypothetical protein
MVTTAGLAESRSSRRGCETRASSLRASTDGGTRRRASTQTAAQEVSTRMPSIMGRSASRARIVPTIAERTKPKPVCQLKRIPRGVSAAGSSGSFPTGALTSSCIIPPERKSTRSRLTPKPFSISRTVSSLSVGGGPWSVYIEPS